MTRGGKAALLTATFALAGCTTASHQLKIRTVADPISALRNGDELAVARGQLALNNVGLALEAFRKVQRDQPSNPAPLVGIADCYSVMGRFDLAQSNLESALALAPRNSDVLMRLARVLDLEGQPDRAALARRDAQAALPVPAAHPIAAAPRLAATASVTVALPPARPAVPVRTAEAASPAPMVAPAPAPAPEAPSPTLPKPVTIAPTAVAMLEGAELAGLPPSVSTPVSAPPTDVPQSPAQTQKPVPPRAPAHQDAPPAASAVTSVKVAAAPSHADRTAQLTALFARSEVPAAPLAPPRQASPRNEAVTEETSGPRLERLSPHEVALVTTVRRAATSAALPRTELSSAVRWLPLTPTASRPVVQVLNAARTNGLAASARAILSDRGWRRVGIGNAAKVRQASVVLYPRSRAKLAHSLAAQFGIRSRVIAGSSVVVVLGLDKVGTIRALR